jgi:hypothetical protein
LMPLWVECPSIACDQSLPNAARSFCRMTGRASAGELAMGA